MYISESIVYPFQSSEENTDSQESQSDSQKTEEDTYIRRWGEFITFSDGRTGFSFLPR